MKRFVVPLLALFVCLPGFVVAQEMTTEYYPLKQGSTWEYQAMGNTFTISVAGTEKIKVTGPDKKEVEVECVKLESKVGDDVIATELVRVEKDGVYRYRFNKVDVKPPLKFLHVPPKKDAKWDVNSTASGQGGNDLALKGSFSMDQVDIQVAGKKYEGVFTCKSSGFKVAGQEFSMTYYFAKDVGLVKQEVNIAGNSVTVELQKYTPGKEK